jgi:fatty-acyl-CoA synthase
MTHMPMPAHASPFWPSDLPARVPVPAGSLFANLERSAAARPHHPALLFYGGRTDYGMLHETCLRLGGFLRESCGIARGDRVLICMQNAPQFVIAYYATLAIGAVAVPVNPMNVGDELAHIRADSGARIAIVGIELAGRFTPLRPDLSHVVVARYADHVAPDFDLRLPDIVRDSATAALPEGCIAWQDAVAGPPTVAAEMGESDLCLLPYSSGTTGRPKACRHTHAGVKFTAVAQALWYGFDHDSVVTAFMPLFHVAAMQASMNAGIHTGATLVIMARWDRDLVEPLFARHGVTFWNAAPTMIVDVLASPDFSGRGFERLRTLTGGGSTMPAAVARMLHERFGLTFVEGYGMTETIAPTHLNPPQRAKPQCLGIPIFETFARVVSPETLQDLADGEIGEILVSGPQIMLGYWNQPAADAEAFVELDGRRFLRTGDLGYRDAEGYYFAVDRLKRMINVSGYKVWPAECEAKLYEHPAIRECCVVSAPDAYRGETVFAYVVLKPEFHGKIGGEDIADWARGVMAAYKIPRRFAFVEALPRSGSNKIDWRRLQEELHRGRPAPETRP